MHSARASSVRCGLPTIRKLRSIQCVTTRSGGYLPAKRASAGNVCLAIRLSSAQRW
jgi:hypothetical protein